MDKQNVIYGNPCAEYPRTPPWQACTLPQLQLTPLQGTISTESLRTYLFAPTSDILPGHLLYKELKGLLVYTLLQLQPLHWGTPCK